MLSFCCVTNYKLSSFCKRYCKFIPSPISVGQETGLGSHWAETEVSSRAVAFTWAQRPPLSSLAVGRIHFFAALGLRYHFPFSCWLETTLSSYWQFLALLGPINVCSLLGKVGYTSLFLLRPEKSLCFYRTHVIWLGAPG